MSSSDNNNKNNSYESSSMVSSSSSFLSDPPPHQPAPYDNSSSTTTAFSSSTSNYYSSSYEPIRKYDSDLIVFLDLDRCLIYAQEIKPGNNSTNSSHNPFLQQQQQQQQSTLLNQHHHDDEQAQAPPASAVATATAEFVSRRVESIRVTTSIGEVWQVNIRPGLFQFLNQVTQKFETHVYTSATKEYADAVLDQLDPQGIYFTYRWYRDSCDKGVKYMSRLPLRNGFVNMARVVLVDDKLRRHQGNPNNGILVSYFDNDPNDTALEDVWQLLLELDHYPDVQPILKERFQLAEMYQKKCETKYNSNKYKDTL